MQRKHLTDRHEQLMERILKDNAHKDKYWILGTAVCKRKNKRTHIKPKLLAYDFQPELRKEAYLYEVDNVAGTRNLVWVMHPNDKLSLPTIGKNLSVSGATSSGV